MRNITYLLALVALIVTGSLLHPGRAAAQTWKPVCSVATAKGGQNTWKQISTGGVNRNSMWKKLGDCGQPPPPPTCPNGATDYPTCTPTVPDFDLSFPDRFTSYVPSVDPNGTYQPGYYSAVSLSWSYGRLSASVQTGPTTFDTTVYQLASPTTDIFSYVLRFTLIGMKMTSGGQTAYFTEDYTVTGANYVVDDTYNTGFSDGEVYGGPDGGGPPPGTTVVRTYKVEFFNYNNGKSFSKIFKIGIGPAGCCVN